MLLEVLCPVCEDRYILGTDDLKEPVKCFECGCFFVAEEPDTEDGILLYEMMD
jgi:hypothetical protein